MSLTYKNLRVAWMNARKEKSWKAAKLGTIIADCDLIAKDQNKRDVAEGDVQAVLKKHKKSLVETLKYSACDHTQEELTMVESFMPQLMSESELRDKLRGLTFDNVGKFMSYLKSNYGDRIDMKMASGIAKDFI